MIPKIYRQWWRGSRGLTLMRTPACRIYRGVSIEFWQLAWFRIYWERA